MMPLPAPERRLTTRRLFLTAIVGVLRLAGRDSGGITGWGGLFRLGAAVP